MSLLDAKLILAVLGPVFLVLALTRRGRDGRWSPAAKAWLRVGLVFSVVASWLWWSSLT